jgi:hypothetical protein
MNNINELRIIELLETLVKIQLSPLLSTELRNSKMKKLYEMTGNHSVKDLHNILGISAGSISSIWQKWEILGIIKKDGKFYKKIV